MQIAFNFFSLSFSQFSINNNQSNLLLHLPMQLTPSVLKRVNILSKTHVLRKMYIKEWEIKKQWLFFLLQPIEVLPSLILILYACVQPIKVEYNIENCKWLKCFGTNFFCKRLTHFGTEGVFQEKLTKSYFKFWFS
jgi:hypothetical protein